MGINIKDYGATGDGTTDDSDAIEDAIAAVKAAGGGTVIFPYGSYNCPTISTQTIDVDNISLIGIGRPTITLATGGQILFGVSGADNVTIKSLNIVEDSLTFGSSTGRAVNVTGACEDLLLEDLHVTGLGRSIALGLSGTTDGQIKRPVIRNCKVFQPTSEGILLYHCDDYLVDGCSVTVGWADGFKIGDGCTRGTLIGCQTYDTGWQAGEDGSGSGNGNGLDALPGGQRLNVIGCIFRRSRGGLIAIEVDENFDYDEMEINIVGCQFLDNLQANSIAGHGIEIKTGSDVATTPLPHHINISGCSFSGIAGAAIFGNYGRDVNISNVSIRNTGQNGIWIRGDCYNWNINNFLIAGAGTESADTYQGILMESGASDIRVTNGTVCGSFADDRIQKDQSGETLYTKNGIQATGTCTNITVENVNIEQVTNVPLNMASGSLPTARVRNAVGSNYTFRDTVTITAGNTTGVISGSSGDILYAPSLGNVRVAPTSNLTTTYSVAQTGVREWTITLGSTEASDKTFVLQADLLG